MTDPSNALEGPLVEELPASTKATAVWERLTQLPRCVFFDSALSHNELGRYSFVAADPFDWIVLEVGCRDPFARLESVLRRFATHHLSELPPFQGGLAGLFGYDLNRSLETIAPPKFDSLGVPAVAAGLYDVVVAFDHLQHRSWIISQGFPHCQSDLRRQRASQRLAMFRELLLSPTVDPPGAEPVATRAVAAAPRFATRHNGTTSNFSEAAYLTAVQQIVEYIHAGDAFQVNLAQQLMCRAKRPSIELYQRLRACNPAPMAGYFDLGNMQICSASPERLISVRQGCVETRPIKGTRARSRQPEADLFAGDELQASVKDRAENIMIVDLLRNDLSKSCAPHSVRVTKLCGLERYAYVQHLVSVITGRLATGKSALDVLESAFPGGSITGAPKVRAMQIIAELEQTARGAYCGSLAYVGFDGACDSSILIRTITAAGGHWQFPVGGGIVADSVPAAELEETWHKAEGMLRAM
jgi:para-aminobenzoate synthetase component 1